jgi:hypothetical protein
MQHGADRSLSCRAMAVRVIPASAPSALRCRAARRRRVGGGVPAPRRVR